MKQRERKNAKTQTGPKARGSIKAPVIMCMEWRRKEDVDKKDEVPNSTVHRQATCHAEERQQKTTGEKKGKGLISGATNEVQGKYDE